jgi:hypothetical protein
MSSESFLFPLVWAHAPLLSTLRAWPRATIVLVLPLALLFARAYDFWQGQNAAARARHAIHLLVIGTAILSVQLILWGTRTFDFYHVRWFAYMDPSSFVVMTFVSMLFLMVVTWTTDLGRVSVRSPMLLATIVLMFVASDVGQYGRRIWTTGTVSPPGPRPSVVEYFETYLQEPRTDGIGMVVPYQPTMGVMANWYFERYVAFAKRYGQLPSFPALMGREGPKVFLLNELDAPPDRFEAWWSAQQAFAGTARATVKGAARFDGTALELQYFTEAPGWLAWIDNWDAGWRAMVNGAPAAIARPFGTFKAVRVQPGLNLVRFEYAPAFPAWWLTPAGALLAMIFMASHVRRSRRRSPLIVKAGEDVAVRPA